MKECPEQIDSNPFEYLVGRGRRCHDRDYDVKLLKDVGMDKVLNQLPDNLPLPDKNALWLYDSTVDGAKSRSYNGAMSEKKLQEVSQKKVRHANSAEIPKNLDSC